MTILSVRNDDIKLNEWCCFLQIYFYEIWSHTLISYLAEYKNDIIHTEFLSFI